jgi:hypothetical protein
MLRFTVLIPVLLVGCVSSGDEGMYVLNNSAVPDGSCVLSGSTGQAQLGHGFIDYRSPSSYIMTPLILSRIMKDERATDHANRTIQLRGADVALTLKAVSVEDAAGNYRTTQPNKVYPSFSVLFSGSLGPGGSVTLLIRISISK